MSKYTEMSKGILSTVSAGMSKQNELIQEITEGPKPVVPTGNTYNFYSPKPINEYEAARQMEKAERDLAEGYYI